jgi:hypothetical protein
MLMIATGDTTSHDVADWAHNQAAHLGGSHLLLLLVLAHVAFYRRDNPERAPVGQVLHGFSGIPVLCDWTGLSRTTVMQLLTDLQVEHGYLLQRPRPQDGRLGRQPRIIRLFWTTEHDAMRQAARDGLAPLPDAFSITAHQVEIRNRIPTLRVVSDAGVEQLRP